MSTGSAIEMETIFESSFEEQATGTHGPNSAALRQVAAERLAAHRRRRAIEQEFAQQEEERARQQAARSQQRLEAARRSAREDQRRGQSSVREAVAQRYRNTESYREYLAHEAERTLAQAQAEAEAAAQSARAAAEAQRRLIENLEEVNRPESGPREHAIADARGELAYALTDIALGARELIAESAFSISEVPTSGLSIVEAPSQAPRQPVREISANGLTVRLFEDMPVTPPRPAEVRNRRGRDLVEHDSLTDAPELDEEIEFRRAPEFEPIRFETTPIPANIIEFPRELVAAKKARPRLAEGPLREEPAPETPQLRIFEVAPELPASASGAYASSTELSTAVFAEPEPTYTPAWQNMMLEPPAETIARAAEPHLEPHSATLPLHPCSIEQRLMALTVDALCLLATFTGFACTASWAAGPALQSMTLPLLAMTAIGTLAVTTLLFQLAFFTLSDATPGMRFARLSLCTFADGNPTRKAMRRRILATVLAACPAGLGLLWMFLDEEGLGWHDRVTRMYLRSY